MSFGPGSNFWIVCFAPTAYTSSSSSFSTRFGADLGLTEGTGDFAIVATPVDASLRRHAGLSQEELGFESGLHRTEIGFLERGDRDPQLKTLVRLSQGLSVSVSELLEGIGPVPARLRRDQMQRPARG